MNKLKYTPMILLSFTLLSLNSCKETEEDARIIVDTVEDGMNIQVNSQEILLSQDKMDETALSFTWDPAQKRKSSGWGCPFLRPVVGNASIWADNRVHATPGGYNPDNKWLITAEEAGKCLLTIDALTETITLVKQP